MSVRISTAQSTPPDHASRFACGSTVFGEIARVAERHPDALALRFLDDGGDDSATFSYAGLDRAARALAARLQAEHATGERVLILLSPGLDYVVALLGCLYSGAVAVPGYPPRRRTMDRLGAIARNCGARFALAQQSDIARLSEGLAALTDGPAVRWIAIDDPAGPQASDWRAPDLDPDAPALLQYTSGSTGEPKGVCLSHANFLANVDALAQHGQLGSEDHIVSWLPPFHDMGLISGILQPLLTAVPATLMSPGSFLQRPYRWLETISRFGGTVSGGPNFGYELCLRRVTEAEQIARLDLGRWRIAFCGAERIQPATLERFARHFAPAGFDARALTGCYGLAESTVAVTCAPTGRLPSTVSLDDTALRSGRVVPPADPASAFTLVSSGSALPGCEVRIVDPQACTALPEARVGEVWVHSASVGSGYWGQPELSAQVFRATLYTASGGSEAVAPQPFLRTGDLGFLQDGELYITGRIKDLIVLRGANHYPDDFETSMRAAHPSLATGGSAAFGTEFEGEERLVLVQEVPRQLPVSLETLEGLIRTAIASDHEIAADRVLLVAPGALPRTSSGKVQRQATRAAFLEGQLVSLQARARPEEALARASQQRIDAVAELMAGLLGVPRVLPDEDFFWLGGHSLLATQLVSRLRARFAVDLPLRVIFESPTPRRLAAAIEAVPADYTVPAVLRRGSEAPLELSFSQERMWMVHQLDPEGAAYNVVGAVFVDGPLDPVALQLALDAVIRRHEVLRCTYPAVDGAPTVVLAETLEVGIPLVDLTGVPGAAERAVAEAAAMAQRPFNIESEPLIRIQLWRLGPGQHVIGASLHHLVTDGWSMGILVSELFRFHDDLAASANVTAAAPDVSYLDYARWQRQYLSNQRLQDQLDYWKGQLAGSSPIELPSDYPRSAERSSRGDFVPVTIPEDLQLALGRLGAAHGTTLFMVLLAAFEVLLHRHTGSADLVVGIPCANRNHLASEQLLGSLVNTLALRVRFDPDAPFLDLLRAVRAVALDAYAHQDLPFEHLVSALPVERRAGESPVVSVMFDYQNAPISGLGESRLQARPAVISRKASQFDLSLLIIDTQLGRVAGIEYRTDLFDRASIDRLLGHYLAILQQIILDPVRAPARIPLFAAGEREALLEACGPVLPIAPPALTVAEAIVAQARRAGAETAVQDDHRSLSYAGLDQESERLAHHLRTLGVGPGERVAVILERECTLVVALLAVLKTGAAYVPIDPSYPQDRIAYVLEDAAPRVVVTTQALQSIVPACLQAACCLLDAIALAADLPPAADPVTGEVAYVLYTSGSTGRPKGVAVGSAALANFLRSMAHTPGIRAGDRVLAITTVAFDIAGLELWLPLTQGASVRLASTAATADPLALMALMADWQPTLMQATPATWRMLLAAQWPGQPGLHMLCGGEAMPADLVPPLLSRGASLWNMYGPTETTIWSTVHRVTAADTLKIPIGRPIDETRIYVLDRLGQLQPRGVTGEIHIAGTGVAEGYFGRPDLTAERFLPDPFAGVPGARMYRTGDGGRLRADGCFECMPRLDDQIKLRGFRIEPGEIEAVLKEHPEVLDAVVVAPEIAPGDRRLVAYYVAKPDAAGTDLADALLAQLQKRLPAYMIPQVLTALPELPKTPNGKIDRKALPAPRFEGSAGTDAFVAPRDPVETELAALWQELLGVERVGIRDNFFRIGGYSLLAMRMLARLQKRYGVVLPPALLFQFPTVEHLGEQVRLRLGETPVETGEPPAAAEPPAHPAAAAVPEQPAVVFRNLLAVQDQGSWPRLFCIHGAGGNVFNFADLAESLGPQQPLYAFQARGVDGVEAPHQDIPAMASAYLEELRALQPVGPYHLAGYCGGGIIAFEMACRLRAAGAEVGLLALIDCYHPGLVVAAKSGSRANGTRRPLLRRARDWALRHSHALTAQASISLHRLLGRPVPFEHRDFWLTSSFLAAAKSYRPGVYAGPVALLRAADMAPELRAVGDDLGWRQHVQGVIETVRIPGNHLTLLVQPNIQALAAALRRWLEAARRSG